ncbi:MAG: YceI family protein [Planctomycetota bacterium]|jgi:polyisoprenoid-binding protein YceI
MTARLICAASIVFCVALSVGTSSPEPAQDAKSDSTAFEIDPVHSTFTFRVRHFDVSWFWGRVNAPEGEFKLDADDLAGSYVNITAQIKNMDAGNNSRNGFLMSPDFFNVREYPTAEFRSTSVSKADGDAFDVTGTFTMHGVTRPITVRVDDFTTVQTTKFGFRGGFECTFEVNRSDYGMDLFVKERTLGDTVRIIASIESKGI